MQTIEQSLHQTALLTVSVIPNVEQVVVQGSEIGGQETQEEGMHER